MTLTYETLRAYIESAEKATPGKWIASEYGTVTQSEVIVGSIKPGFPPKPSALAHLDDGEYIENPNAEADAAFIAASRSIGPAAAEEVLRLRAEIDGLMTALTEESMSALYWECHPHGPNTNVVALKAWEAIRNFRAAREPRND